MRTTILAVLMCCLVTSGQAQVTREIAYADSVLACLPDTLYQEEPQTWWINGERIEPPFVLEWVGERLLLNQVQVVPRERESQAVQDSQAVQLSELEIQKMQLERQARQAVAHLSDTRAKMEGVKAILQDSPIVATVDEWDDGLRVIYSDGDGEVIGFSESPRRQEVVDSNALEALRLYNRMKTTARLNHILIIVGGIEQTIADTDDAYRQINQSAEAGSLAVGPIHKDALKVILEGR